MLLTPGLSQAVLIDFNVGGGVIVNDLFPGVHFRAFGPSLAGTGPGPTPLAALPAGATGNVVTSFQASPVGGQFAGSVDGPGNRGILISFDTEIVGLSLVGVDGGGDSVLDDEDVTLTAFDAAGNVLGSTFFNVDVSPVGQDEIPASISFPGIRHVAFLFSDTLGFFHIDNLEYTPGQGPVPEPSSLLLFALGLAAIVGLRNRRRMAGA
jgi:hypothetical protein